MNNPHQEQRCGFIALIGAPNAGKSTLLNQLVGSKLAIVTPKAQTTRNRITGICVEGNAQLVFVDTPGIFAADRKFELAMVRSAWQGAMEADIILLVIDAKRGVSEETEMIIRRLTEQQRKNVHVVLNKVDLVNKPDLLTLTQTLHELMQPDKIFMISALSGDGVVGLKHTLAQILPNGPWLFPEDHLSDIPQRLLAAEITREKLFLLLKEELPYSIAVETEQWEEKKDGSVKISQVVYVQRESQKKIVVGKGGEMLKKIGTHSRQELERVLGHKAHLFLFVKVVENWKESPDMYQMLGLEFKA